MATPREKEAAAYLEKHKIVELMDNLTSMLFFYRPENPTEFLINQLDQMEASKQKAVDAPCLFDESNLDSLFGILDPTKQKCITYVQYKEALTTLGIADINIDKCPEGADEDRISRETFKREARKGLQRSSDTYFQS